MSKFKVGDRVAIYSGCCRSKGIVVEGPSNMNGLMKAQESCGSAQWYHPKQLRKLVKKERRRIYFEVDQNGEGYSDYHKVWESLKPNERVEFVEVRKKK